MSQANYKLLAFTKLTVWKHVHGNASMTYQGSTNQRARYPLTLDEFVVALASIIQRTPQKTHILLHECSWAMIRGFTPLAHKELKVLIGARSLSGVFRGEMPTSEDKYPAQQKANCQPACPTFWHPSRGESRPPDRRSRARNPLPRTPASALPRAAS